MNQEARTALAESISAELGADLDNAAMALVDRILTRLYLFGFIVSPTPEQENVDA